MGGFTYIDGPRKKEVVDSVLDESIEFHKIIAEKVKIIVEFGDDTILELIKKHKFFYDKILNKNISPIHGLFKTRKRDIEKCITKHIAKQMKKINKTFNICIQ